MWKKSLLAFILLFLEGEIGFIIEIRKNHVENLTIGLYQQAWSVSEPFSVAEQASWIIHAKNTKEDLVRERKKSADKLI